MIGLMMSALASPTSDAFGPLPIHDRILSSAVSLSPRYKRSSLTDALCSVLAIAASSVRRELVPSSALPTPVSYTHLTLPTIYPV